MWTNLVGFWSLAFHFSGWKRVKLLHTAFCSWKFLYSFLSHRLSFSLSVRACVCVCLYKNSIPSNKSLFNQKKRENFFEIEYASSIWMHRRQWHVIKMKREREKTHERIANSLRYKIRLYIVHMYKNVYIYRATFAMTQRRCSACRLFFFYLVFFFSFELLFAIVCVFLSLSLSLALTLARSGCWFSYRTQWQFSCVRVYIKLSVASYRNKPLKKNANVTYPNIEISTTISNYYQLIGCWTSGVRVFQCACWILTVRKAENKKKRNKKRLPWILMWNEK